MDSLNFSKRFAFLFASAALLLSSAAFALGEKVSPEATEEVRLASAREKLSSQPDTVVVYAKGLCCPSCAIGIRKKISKLEFVDRSRFNKGVELDTKTQLVSVAVRKGSEANYDSLAKAVDDAGYDPARAYFLNGSELSTRSIALAVN